MIFDSLELQNFGAYRHDVIPLRPPSADRPIVLFGGLNGAGKTTILEAIQLALYGKRVQTAKREALSYEEYLRRCVHHSASPRDGASVKLAFSLRTSGVERSMQVARYWRATRSGVRESVEVFVDGEYDELLTNEWPEYIDEVIPAGISHLFFFDGEQIAQFADIGNARDLLRTAIHGLLGLDLIDRLALDLQVLERRKGTLLRTEDERLEIEKAEEEVVRAASYVGDIQKRVKGIEALLVIARDRLSELQERFSREGGELFERRGSLEERAARLEKDLEDLREALRGRAAGVAPLLLVRDLLEHVAEGDRLEQEQEVVSVVLGVLEQRDQELLDFLQALGASGPLVDDARQHLASDRSGRAAQARAETMFGLSKDTRGTLGYLVRDGFEEEVEAIRALSRELDALEREQGDVSRQLEAVPDQDALTQLIRQRGEALSRVAELERDLTVAREEGEAAGRGLERAESALKKLSQKAFRQDQSRLEDVRVVDYSRRARENLDDFRVEVLRKNVDRIRHYVLESFRYLLRKQGLVRDVGIDPSSLALTITGDSGQAIHPDRLSAGERQLLAVSLLWGMAKASSRALPMVVDTPLGRLDSVHRQHLVQRYFPEASHQVILLSTDEEITESHLADLQDHVGLSYYLDYDEALKRTVVTEGYFALEPAK